MNEHCEPCLSALDKLPVDTSSGSQDPLEFYQALDFQMRRHSDTNQRLHEAVVKKSEAFNVKTLSFWRRGLRVPQNLESFRILARIEKRYGLPLGYFKAKITGNGRAALDHSLRDIPRAERRRLAWHLPNDFAQRSRAQQEEVLAWVRNVIVSGSTGYRKFQASAMKRPYALWLGKGWASAPLQAVLHRQPRGCCADAPELLCREMEQLVLFKTSVLTEVGFQRTGVWGMETAAQKVEHFSLLFGALTSSPDGPIKGRGVPEEKLALAMLVFPSVWDWYLRWRAERRGFYTSWEADMLQVARGLTRRDTGWIRQNPQLNERLQPVDGLIADADIDNVRRDWNEACDRFHAFAGARVKEIERIARVHRDPFEPILTILEANSPVSEYRKIADEILRRVPDKRRYPLAAAEAERSYLMVRLGLHLGLRQKNLRQLLFKRRGQAASSERYLEDRRCGELRWNARDEVWEVFIPAAAFKNVNSSFFAKRPFRLQLPDLAGLYQHIDEYLNHHRGRLLRGAEDPGTFFVKTVKKNCESACKVDPLTRGIGVQN